jgi:DNA-binding beta-propeller fold protein YncE
MSAAVASSRTVTWPAVHSHSAACVHGYGMCVSLKHGLIIVSQFGKYDPFQLHMHSLLDGSLVRSIGSNGAGKGQFMSWNGGLCVSPDGDSVLVAEQYNDRVQQVKIADGSWERFVGVGVLEWPDFVDCNTDAIAVTETRLHRICVFSWADGSVLAQFGSQGSGPGELKYPRGLRLLRDSNELVVADTDNSRLCLFTVTGEFVSTITSKHRGLANPLGVIEYGAGGGFIAASQLRMSLTHVSRAGAVVDVFDRTVASAIQLSDPRALAALPEGGLVVRSYERLRVFNGRNVVLGIVHAPLVTTVGTSVATFESWPRSKSCLTSLSLAPGYS